MKGMKGKLLKKMKSIKPVGYLKLENRVLQVSAWNSHAVNSCQNNFGDQSENKLVCEEKTEQKKTSSIAEQERDVIDVPELMRSYEEDDPMSFRGDFDDKENIGPTMAKKGSTSLKPKEAILGRVERELSQSRVSEVSESPEIKSPRNSGLSEIDSLSFQLPDSEDKENIVPEIDASSGFLNPKADISGIVERRVSEAWELSEVDVSSFRKPDLNSYTLFDPNLLSAFHQAVAEYFRLTQLNSQNHKEEAQDQEPPSKSPRIDQKEEEDEEEEEEDPLLEFDLKCPPGGSESVILYTTSLRGIRKTFEGCVSIKFLLESFRVLYMERDVSMHAEFREELRRVAGRGAVPPKLFVKGRFVGGAEEVLVLHEQGKLRPLLRDFPVVRSDWPCEGCGGFRFVVCFNCNGSQKVIGEDGVEFCICPKCNENGLVICPLCC